METRYRRHVCEKASAVPPEVWQLIVSFLAPSDAVRAALVCSEFAAISTPAAQQSCRRLWPQHSKRLAACCSPGVQRFLRLVQTHEDEVAAHPDVSKAKSVQRTVCPEHRQIAVEWLIEVGVQGHFRAMIRAPAACGVAPKHLNSVQADPSRGCRRKGSPGRPQQHPKIGVVAIETGLAGPHGRAADGC